MLTFAKYETLAGPTIRLMFDTERAQRELLAVKSGQNARALAVMRSVKDWNIQGVKPTRQVLREVLPMEITMGCAHAIISSLCQHTRRQISL